MKASNCIIKNLSFNSIFSALKEVVIGGWLVCLYATWDQVHPLTFVNILDPDQVRDSARPGLDPKGLTFWRYSWNFFDFLKSAYAKSMQN